MKLILNALRASAANSVFSHAIVFWAEDLAKTDSNLSKQAKGTLRKISLSATFTTDASLDSLQFCSRAMASNVVDKRNVWLLSWDLDAGSQVRLATSSFNGKKLFGQALNLVLIESKDKRKILPKVSKGDFSGRPYQTFHPFRSQTRGKGQQRFKPKGLKDFRSSPSSSPLKVLPQEIELPEIEPHNAIYRDVAPRVGAVLLHYAHLWTNGTPGA